MRYNECRIAADGFLELLYTAIWLSCIAEDQTQVCVNDWRSRIERQRIIRLLKAFVESTHHSKEQRIPMVRSNIVWIEFDRATEMAFSLPPIPVVDIVDKSE